MSNTKKKTTKAKEVKEAKVEKEVEVKEEREMAEDFKDAKDDKKKNTIIKILDIVLWVILIGWMVIVFMDYYRVTNEKEPKFCIKEETIQYEDGTVESCTGLGYKVYEYKRDSFKAIEFGPFWAKDRSEKEAAE